MTYDMIKASMVQAALNGIYMDAELKKISDIIEQCEMSGTTADEALKKLYPAALNKKARELLKGNKE